MIYIIDGHNLIPKIPGLSLRMLDDELKLVNLLQDYARIRRLSLEVYFDQASPGNAGKRHFGMVTAHFVRQGSTADQEIIRRLSQMKKTARSMILVTSDRRIKVEAQALRVEVVSSEDFASRLVEAIINADLPADKDLKNGTSSDMDEWLTLFGAEDEKS